MEDTRKEDRVLLLGIFSILFLILPYCASIFLGALQMEGVVYNFFVDFYYFCLLADLVCGITALILGTNYFTYGGKKNAKVVTGIVISILILCYSLFVIALTLRNHNHHHDYYNGEMRGCYSNMTSAGEACYD